MHLHAAHGAVTPPFMCVLALLGWGIPQWPKPSPPARPPAGAAPDWPPKPAWAEQRLLPPSLRNCAAPWEDCKQRFFRARVPVGVEGGLHRGGGGGGSWTQGVAYFDQRSATDNARTMPMPGPRALSGWQQWV